MDIYCNETIERTDLGLLFKPVLLFVLGKALYNVTVTHDITGFAKLLSIVSMLTAVIVLIYGAISYAIKIKRRMFYLSVTDTIVSIPQAPADKVFITNGEYVSEGHLNIVNNTLCKMYKLSTGNNEYFELKGNNVKIWVDGINTATITFEFEK